MKNEKFVVSKTTEMIVIKNNCNSNISLKEILLPPGGVKRLPWERLRDDDLLQEWSRGFIDIIDWPKGKEPISYGNGSPTQYQLPQGKMERLGAWWPENASKAKEMK